MLNESESPPLAQRREQADPSERHQPVPLTVAAITLALVLFGVGYLLHSEAFGNAQLGDRRTVADLSGPVAQAGGNLDGKALFSANCAACHQATGKGLPGVFPPLDGSEWVNGNERTVVNILLHGINGEIAVIGNTYKGSMPSFQHLGDAELAAIVSYVRGAWSNKAVPLNAQLFAQERKSSARKVPFAGGEELKALTAHSP
ncbi:MAG: cytochrome c [Burkholderiales bacterium]|nr:cytochrome c [Burkholderiales bacterium]